MADGTSILNVTFNQSLLFFNTNTLFSYLFYWKYSYDFVNLDRQQRDV